jgi:hypothetical protein
MYVMRAHQLLWLQHENQSLVSLCCNTFLWLSEIITSYAYPLVRNENSILFTSNSHILLPTRHKRIPPRQIPTLIINNRQTQHARRERRAIHNPRPAHTLHQLISNLPYSFVRLALFQERTFRFQAFDQWRFVLEALHGGYGGHVEEYFGLHYDPGGAGEFGC